MLYCKKIHIIYSFILWWFQEGIPTEGKDPAWRCTYTLGKSGLLLVYGNEHIKAGFRIRIRIRMDPH